MSKEMEQLSAEQAADLRQLEGMAGADPAALAEAEVMEQEPPRMPLADEIAGMVLSVTTILSPALPSLRAIYTPETTQAASAALAAVCEKRGWLSGGLMGEWSEEITAGMILLPLGITTYQGVKMDVAALKAKADAAAGKQQAAPTAPGVTIGAEPSPDIPKVPVVTIGEAVPA